MLTRADWQSVIDIQDASNMGGVANHFAKIVQKVWEEAHATGQGTSWVNQHPLVQLMADKIVDLARARHAMTYSGAYTECQRRVAEWEMGEEVVLEGHDDTNQVAYPWEFIRILSCRDALKKFDQSWWGYPHLRMVPTRDKRILQS